MRKLMSLMFCLGMLLIPNCVSALDEPVLVGTEAELRTAIESGKDVVLKNDITVSSISSSTADNGRDRSAVVISSSVTIDGDGYTIDTSTVGTVFDIYYTGSSASEIVEVSFNDITIKNTKAGGRCIDTRTGNIELNLNSANLIVEKLASNTNRDQALTIGGNYSNPIDVNLIDTKVTTGKAGYAITVFNPVNLTIDSSNITGYGALVMKGVNNSQGSAGSTVTIKNNSVLTSVNEFSGTTDDFGTIILEDDNIIVNVEDSSIEAIVTGSSAQFAFGQYEDIVVEKENKITVSGDSKITVNSKDELKSSGNNAPILTIQGGVESNVEIPEEYLPENVELEEDEDGNFVAVTKYKVTLNKVANGSVTLSKEEAKKGETIKVEAIADQDYLLKNIEVVDEDGNEVTFEDGEFVMPDSDVEITVTFEEIKYKVTLNKVVNGTVKVSKDEVKKGETIKVEVIADKEYLLKNIEIVDGDGNEVTFEDGEFVMPDSDVEITVTFEKVVNPSTSDNILTYIGFGLISLLCLSFILSKKTIV